MFEHFIIKDELLAIIFLACVISLSSYCTASPVLLVELGATRITSTDISYKIAVEKSYGNTTINDTAALVSLINDVFDIEVGKLVGITAVPEVIAAFW